jgi:hypothetical protein
MIWQTWAEAAKVHTAVFIDAQFTKYIIETQLAQCSHYSSHTITLHNGNQAVPKPGM